MNLDQLKVFLAVSKHLHFSRAAEELYITQPAVSASVARLETEFGLKLFHRIGRRVELTDAGRFLAREGQYLLEQVSQLERRLLEFNALKRGVLTIGASFTVGNYWLPLSLKLFRDSHASIDVHCGLGNAEQVLEGTIRGEYDLGFISGSVEDPLPDHLRSEAVGEESLRVVVGTEHPWFGMEKIEPAALSQAGWVLREKGSGARQMFADGLMKLGVNIDLLPVSMVLNSSEMVKMLVLQGGGAAALPESMIRQEASLGKLWTIEVDGLTMRQSILMIRHAQREHSSLIGAFEQHVHAANVIARSDYSAARRT